MPIHNSEIAEIFDELADLLEIQGENRFRVRAYRQAARTVSRLSRRAQDMVKKGEDLSKLQGIGKDLAGKIKEIVETGKLKKMAQIKKKTPQGLADLMRLPYLGPKKVQKLYQELGVKTKADLKKALAQGKVEKLEGFAEKTVSQIKNALQEKADKDKRMLFYKAEKIIEPLVEYLRDNQDIVEVKVAGSFRRRQETVGDIDILAIVDKTDKNKSQKIMDYFTAYDEVEEILVKGDTKSSVVLRIGLQVDLRLIAKQSRGAAMLYFTGSKQHNIDLRQMAQGKGLKINEYGLYKGKKRLAGKTEKEIYNYLKLRFIPPELRESRGEIEAAQKRLPHLIELSDIKGDLQMHTTFSDGTATIEEMAQRAKQLGYQYIAVTDHTGFVGITQGLKENDVAKYLAEIDRINDKLKGIVILKSSEVDIKADGTLYYPPRILKKFDLVLGAIHSSFNLPLKEQTERILRALDNPYLNILAHPTGRLLPRRKPYEIDLRKILQKAKENNCILEINATPQRLDLNDIHAKTAKEMGVKLAISTDAHSPEELQFIKYGVFQARRAWLEKADIINTRPLSQLKKLLKK